MTKLQAWVHASRLRTLPLAFSSIITGSAIAHYRMPDNFSWRVLILCLLTTLLLQILSNLANDYGDSEKLTDNEERVGPTRAIQSGVLSFKEMKIGIVICSLLILFSGVWLIIEATGGLNTFIGLFFFAMGIAAIAAAIKYTIGKSAYGYMGLGDLFVFVFFGLVGVCGSYYLQAKAFSNLVFLPAAAIGFLSVTVLHLNNMRDIIGDKKSGKITLAVRLGFTNSKYYFYVLIFAAFAFLVAFFLWQNIEWWRLGIASIAFILFLFSCYKVFATQTPKDLDPLLKVNALATFLLSLLLVVALM